MIKFNAMHTHDTWLFPSSLNMVIIMAWVAIAWSNILVSLRIYAPVGVWIGSVILAVLCWLFRICVPRTYDRFRVAKRKAEEQQKAKPMQKQGERVRDVEANLEGEGTVLADIEVQGEVGEETPLRS